MYRKIQKTHKYKKTHINGQKMVLFVRQLVLQLQLLYLLRLALGFNHIFCFYLLFFCFFVFIFYVFYFLNWGKH